MTIQKGCVRCAKVIPMGASPYCPDCAAEKRRTDRLRGKARMTQRKRILSLYGNQCAAMVDSERCTVMGPLELHHIDGDRRNDDFVNQVPLSRPHHLECAGMPPEAFAKPVQPWIA